MTNLIEQNRKINVAKKKKKNSGTMKNRKSTPHQPFFSIFHAIQLTQHSRNCLASIGDVKFKPHVSFVIGSFQ